MKVYSYTYLIYNMPLMTFPYRIFKQERIYIRSSYADIVSI
jgi:hypothetical protein